MAEINFTHAHDRAVVFFAGQLDWPAAHELADTIGIVVETYFYRRAELVVASPGGDIRAFGYLLGALNAWSKRGVQFTTRVTSTAASCAAVLVSGADERLADPGARLGFHHARLNDATDITARKSLALRGALGEADRLMVGTLVDRAFVDRYTLPDVVYEAERSDREVLERLCAALPSGRGPKGRKPRHLARALGRHVARAIRDGDRQALGAIYHRLFDLELQISARLALTLRLVDRVGTPAAQEFPTAGTPGITVPEWVSLFPPAGEVPREVLTRHTLVLGETGSGKTASAVLPLVAAMARAPAARFGGALIIDPKRELAPVLEELAPQRLHHVTGRDAVIDVMAGPRWSLDDDLDAGRWQSAAVRILCRAASFVRSSPARVLMDHEIGSANAEFFDREGTSLAASVLSLVLMLISPELPDPQQWLEHDVEAYAWIEELIDRARGHAGERGPNVLTLASWALDGSLMTWPENTRTIRLSCVPDSSLGSRPSSPWLCARIASSLLDAWGGRSVETRDVLRRICEYWEPQARIERQYAGVRATASIICSDFAAPAIGCTLYFGCEPGIRSQSCPGLDFARLVAVDGPGTLVLFQPARDGLDNLIAVSLKAAYFEAVPDDPDRAQGCVDPPLVGYVADEFHRFATSDPVHGEQSFLDTCRSFGAMCVLACQSVASIEHALAHGGGSQRQDEASVEILWNNTASKVIFRSTDPKTGDRVADLCPYRPGLAGLVRVRPVSTLQVGECYAALADGRFERRQLEPFALDDHVRETALPKLLPPPNAREEVPHEHV